MADKTDCLFSLELVVDKLYLPHVVCRFPALAFRLLDFPTILIRHVEQEVAEKIKEKISAEPDYQTPFQFAELKDKHGNFMVKKGKSCLFKISLDTLRAHLTSTPLYVMVVDSFTDVPKLLGNSTVPLDKIIDNISNDIAKVGNSIPSVHGDKGLFKIYNLMGKEIGYVILGYRILSVGPSLVPHLSDQIISHKEGKREELPNLDIKPPEEPVSDQQCRPSSQTAWTTTDYPKLQEALMQTDEFGKEDKSIHVDIPYYEKDEIEKKTVHSISTQTTRRQKTGRYQHEKLTLSDKGNQDDDILITNVSRPPPLFYTGKKDRKTMWIKRNEESIDLSDSKFEDYSDVVSVTTEDESTVINSTKGHVKREHHPSDNFQQHHTNGTSPAEPATRQVPQTLSENNMFPFLSALLHELSCLQAPHGFANLPQQLQQTGFPITSLPNQNRNTRAVNGRSLQSLQKAVPRTEKSVRVTDSDQAVGGDNIHVHEEKQQSPEHKSGRLSHRSCTGDHHSVPRNKSWLRKTPEQAVKKSKLTFGMTNTQRLRLAKGNPQLFRALEREKGNLPAAKQLKTPQEEFEEGNLSDMSTEIRRHTLDDMEETSREHAPSSMEDNNAQPRQSAEGDKSVRVSFSESVEKFISPSLRRRKKTKHRRSSPGGRERKGTQSPQPRTGSPIKAPTHTGLRVNIAASNSNEDNNQVTDTGTEETPRLAQGAGQEEPVVAVMPDLPQYVPYEVESSDSDMQQESLSHRSGKSIEVRLPSVEPQSGLSEEESNVSNSTERPENGASKMNKLASFAGFPRESNGYWDSIEPSKSRQERSDDELGDTSYVPSWGINSEVDGKHQSSAVFSSTGDFDSRQFRSTEEQELLDLLSDGEEEDSYHSVQGGNSEHEDVSGKTKSSDKASVSTVLRIPVLNPLQSESSPVPSTRRSIARAELSGAPTTEPLDGSPTSSKRPTPRPRGRKGRELEKKDSIHTESVSTYVPSDAENVNTSLASDPTYSEDFHNMGSDDEGKLSPLPRYIPTTKLGYTIA